MAPAVGQQITLDAESSAAVVSRLNLLRQRADAGECDLVAKTRTSDDEAGFLYVGSGFFLTDRRGQPPITSAALQSLATEHPVTYTCVPPGSGERIGVDRDGDGAWDGDERRAHSDPADPASRP
jgi:predicted nucleic acid-binding Zn ribbon protein